MDADDKDAAAPGPGPAGAEIDGPATVTFQPSGRRFAVTAGDTLFESAVRAGVEVDTVCGGNGSCGKCKVRFEGDPPRATAVDFTHLAAGEIAKGYRLSCQIVPQNDMIVHVPESGARAQARILHHGMDRRVDLQPNIRKAFIPYTNPRAAQHVSDWDRVQRFWPRQSRPHGIGLDLLRALPAAIRDEAGMTVVTAGRTVIGLERGDTAARQFGIAFDIGSTTIVGFLVDLATGDETRVASTVNSQTQWGDDIIGRLARAQRNPDGLAELHAMIIGQMNELVRELADAAGIEAGEIYEATVVGNMAMHHFLLKLDSTNLGLAPYAPVIRSSYTVGADELGLGISPHAPVFVMPNIAGFVGSDTVAVMLAAGLADGNDQRLAIDVGTNGEMALGNRKRLIACSAPAGPALEGARIRMGMRAATGAIDHVAMDGDVRLSVIGGGPPRGICGSALIDIVAGLLDAGLLASSGAFVRRDRLAKSLPAALAERLVEAEKRRDTYFVVARAADTGAAEDIVFTQQDVREMQLAKGAIRAGAMVLLEEMGLAEDELDEVLLAGAFGTFLDAAKARRVGLTPRVPMERITSVGNAAGVGAKMALVNVVERRRAERLAARTEHIQLSGLDGFQKAFATAMGFPDD